MKDPDQMTVDLLCMGEPMLEFSRMSAQPDGRVRYLEGYGGDTSNAAIAAARQGARVGYITAIGQDMAGDVPLAAALYANTAAALACEGLGCVAPIPTAAQVLAARPQ